MADVNIAAGIALEEIGRVRRAYKRGMNIVVGLVATIMLAAGGSTAALALDVSNQGSEQKRKAFLIREMRDCLAMNLDQRPCVSKIGN